MENNETLIKYAWLAFVSMVGGGLGFVKKTMPTIQGETVIKKLKSLSLGIATSMFVAYITYEMILWSIKSERLAIAFAGLASFAGADMLGVLQKKLVDSINK